MQRNRSYIFFFTDIVVVILAYLLCVWIKPGVSRNYAVDYVGGFSLFLMVWILSSFFFRKYSSTMILDNGNVFRTIILSNVFAFAIVTSIMYISRISYFSRLIVVGTFSVASVVELMAGALYVAIARSGSGFTEGDTLVKNGGNGIHLLNGTIEKIKKKKREQQAEKILKSREHALLVEISREAFNFIFSYARIDSPDTLIINTTSRFNIDTQLNPQFESIVNVKRINDIRYINKFFESANARLSRGGLFIDFVETKNLRKRRILRKYPPLLNYLLYAFDYLIKRVFPKFLLTKKIYFFLTRGQNRVLTKAETFGRLYSCGFEVIAENFIDNLLFFVARKIKTPFFPEKPSYGPFVKLERIGKNGKTIWVYKMRTMHPFAEYLQEFVYEKVGLDNGGKFKDDFRISTLGKLMRTFWIDELPMLLNLVKGDLKLVGVRPLSRHYYSLYQKQLQERRIRYKPGMIPPFYVDHPQTLEEIMNSETRYLDAYDKHPFLTDFRYFFRAAFNIIFKRYRSK